MTSAHSQKGSVHAIIMIVLVLAVLGLLGFIFWQNFLNKEATPTPQATTTDTTTTEEVATPAAPAKYTNETYSFEYPAEGWMAVETDYGQMITTELRSDDYAANVGMGTDAGAIITFNVSNIGMTRDAQYTIVENEYPDVHDLKKVTVNGNEAFTFNSGYEGVRYHTYVVKDGMAYDILYQFPDDGDVNTEKATYDQVVASFTLK